MQHLKYMHTSNLMITLTEKDTTSNSKYLPIVETRSISHKKTPTSNDIFRLIVSWKGTKEAGHTDLSFSFMSNFSIKLNFKRDKSIIIWTGGGNVQGTTQGITSTCTFWNLEHNVVAWLLSNIMHNSSRITIIKHAILKEEVVCNCAQER